MTRAEKIEFVINAISDMEGDISRKLGMHPYREGVLPENWDGVELRWYIADRFQELVFGEICKRKGKRYREYKNTVIVNNL